MKNTCYVCVKKLRTADTRNQILWFKLFARFMYINGTVAMHWQHNKISNLKHM
jgi:hypothetical protein